MQSDPSKQFWYFDHERRVLVMLLGWAGGSILSGFLLRDDPSERVRGAGEQFIGWGAIDALLALAGLRGNRQNQAAVSSGSMTLEAQAQAARRLQNLLWFNTGLDVLYVALGRWLLGRAEPRQQGWGIGILIQGGFLFFFDLINALILQERRQHE